MARSQWIDSACMEHLLAGMMPENAEAIRISMDYGLRIGDVLRLPTAALQLKVWSFREEKTGKRRYLRLSEKHIRECMSFAGRYYVFEGRLDPLKHRTRQAVYRDIKRISKAFRLKFVSPHTARKMYAVKWYKRTGGDLGRVRELLHHEDSSVTMIYALADQLTQKMQKTSRTS